MSEQQEWEKVAFLDTNALHYIGLYLTYAKDKNLFPFDPEGIQGKKTDAINSVDSIAEAEQLKRRLKEGLQTADFLLTQGVKIQYAPVSELELLNGRIRGKAVLSMAEEGVPERMWSRIKEIEIRERMTLKDMAETKDGVDGLTLLLEESGLAVRTYKPEQTRDALELTKSINGLVYMEVMDSIIYANAILVGADYLITGDSYLRDTVNLIHCGEGDDYPDINKRLKHQVSQLTLETIDEVELPSAHSMSANGNWQPQLPSTHH